MVEQKETLKPCPFCGGEAELREWDWPYVRFQCRCSKCKCQARARMADRQSAITAWNTRAETPENAALRENLAEGAAFLRRYREETPPGHSPHMICHKVDEYLTQIDTLTGGDNAEG